MLTINLNEKEAKFLWHLIRDVLSQDNEGKNQGTGGILYPEDVGCAMRSMTELAEKIDEYNKNGQTKGLKLIKE